MAAEISKINCLDPATLASFDEVIDVRAPSEFAHDHIPTAINLPVLDDEERHNVGTIYVRDSRFKARRLGAALVARNISNHLETRLADKPPGYRPLVYCWRGGMRSNAMATVLSAVGWRITVVDGGYKTWRRTCVVNLRDAGPRFNIVLLDGRTGTAKTELLKALAKLDVQTVDLEALAEHRGSVFGALLDQQPSQKMFESRLWHRLSRLDFSRPIVMEAESPLIGRVGIPERLLASMRSAPRIEVTAPRDARVRHLIEAYQDLVLSPARLVRGIERLRPHHPKAVVETWIELARNGEFSELAAALTAEHYDPLYDRQSANGGHTVLRRVNLETLEPTSLENTAHVIAQTLGSSAFTAALCRG